MQYRETVCKTSQSVQLSAKLVSHISPSVPKDVAC